MGLTRREIRRAPLSEILWWVEEAERKIEEDRVAYERAYRAPRS